ncbi:MAG TPA: T9SS type B sorting domain-containing protein [Flavobacterium sp.]|nr:T9SS type B sorting domain-containing protein [Flavobacterium sp.]
MAFSQIAGQRSISLNTALPISQPASRITNNNTFSFCDTDSDGFIPIDMESIKNTVLDENVDQFGTEQGIFISTRFAKVHLITNLNGTPLKTEICDGSSGLGGYGMLDIAINQEGETYVAAIDKIYKINSATCAIDTSYDLGLNGNSITSLSFDRNHNIYLGGFDTSVYRMNNGAYGSMQLWHDFGAGAAAGDFVMCKDKMYVAWRLNSGCRLYEVTVDSNTNYVSHIDLGDLPDYTYGLASELGKLYGVTPYQLYKINRNPMTFTAVLNNDNVNDEWYGAAGKNEAVNFEVQIFASEQDAQNNQNPLPGTWTNTVSGGQTVYVVIRNTINNQFITIPADIVVNVAPAYTNPQQLVHCESDSNANVFDLRAAETGIVGSQSNIICTFHESQNDAINNSNPLPDVYTCVNTAAPKTITVRLTNRLTGCFSYFDFILEVAPKPNFYQPKDLSFCASGSDYMVQLDDQNAQILNGQSAEDIEITFHHSMSDAIGGNNPLPVPYHMLANEMEVFVRIENTYSGCFDTGSFHVKAIAENHNFPVNYTVDTNDWTYEQNSIQVLSDGNYEYSLDGISYQESPYFANLSVGEYQLHVRDKDNCSVSIKDIFLLMYPKFFTPNGDGYHDFWNIMLSSKEPDMKIEIYDRYGKVITTLNGKGAGWDGNYHHQQLPASDYWFTVTRENGKEFKGHFTLTR